VDAQGSECRQNGHHIHYWKVESEPVATAGSMVSVSIAKRRAGGRHGSGQHGGLGASLS
jgi:hypothetical protein